MYKPTIVFDFDGVIHSYSSGWKGATVIPDPPVPGIGQVMEDLLERGYEVVIVSSRSATEEGRTAIREWRHFLRLRCSPAAHPDMRVVACMLLVQLKKTYPVFFEDIEV